ncbi:MAG: antibiotic biosynthesis monooxygenase [Calditrichaeota bacterium]|nr:MAG: antibiotic biosynthesis monooxygenase [Calditrichota bacterium]
MFINSPKPPYYAAIFTSELKTGVNDDYSEMAEEMAALAEKQPGYLGIDSVRDADGLGITISYWQSEEDILQWKQNARHKVAQKLGLTQWYKTFSLRICKVERDRFFPNAK